MALTWRRPVAHYLRLIVYLLSLTACLGAPLEDFPTPRRLARYGSSQQDHSGGSASDYAQRVSQELEEEHPGEDAGQEEVPSWVYPKRQDLGKKTLQLHPYTPPDAQMTQRYFDIYEERHLHQKQRFLGVRFGQDPMDALVIQEMVYDVRPDLIIETGTNSGGSALYLAFLLEAINPRGKIITMDIEDLTKWGNKWGQSADPTQYPFWQKRVTQILGSSVAPDTVAQLKAAAAEAETVLVLLDSDHKLAHVRKEIDTLCGLATVGSYCLVQDTWLGDPGEAAAEFLGRNKGKWVNDEAREYLVMSQHRGGWMKRLA